jgi:hypothetical protein
MTKATNGLPMLCLCLLSHLGCGDNTSGASAPPPTVPAAGEPSVPGPNDSGVSGSNDSSAPGTRYPPVPCGSATCSEFPDVPVLVLPPCCANAALGTCGKLSSSGRCAVPPPRDPRCPVVGDWYGCCTANGTCGADVSVFGFGCEDLGDATFRKFSPNAPAPRRCDGTPLPDDDAGANPDAG